MGHTHMDMGFKKHSHFLCYVVNLMTMMISQESGNLDFRVLSLNPWKSPDCRSNGPGTRAEQRSLLPHKPTPFPALEIPLDALSLCTEAISML